MAWLSGVDSGNDYYSLQILFQISEVILVTTTLTRLKKFLTVQFGFGDYDNTRHLHHDPFLYTAAFGFNANYEHEKICRSSSLAMDHRERLDIYPFDEVASTITSWLVRPLVAACCLSSPKAFGFVRVAFHQILTYI